MQEKFTDRIRRKFRERQIKWLRKIIRKAVERLDDLQYHAFMAYMWERDEETDYYVIAERSYPDHKIFGTDVTYCDE